MENHGETTIYGFLAVMFACCVARVSSHGSSGTDGTMRACSQSDRPAAVTDRRAQWDLYWDSSGIMEKKMETTVIILGLYWGYIILGLYFYWGYIILGLYWG